MTEAAHRVVAARIPDGESTSPARRLNTGTVDTVPGKELRS